MSLRLRFGLLLFGVSAGALLLAWFLSASAILGPFFRHVGHMHDRQALQITRQLEQGEDIVGLRRQLGLQIELRRRPPKGKRCKFRRPNLVRCRGPGALRAVESDLLGWVWVRQGQNLDTVQTRLFVLLVILGSFLAAVSWWLAGRVSRPLSVAVQAMNRIAEGDFGHRLPVQRSPELADAAGAFNRMADRMSRMIKAERSLMSGISHELRTPLARLRLEVELLRDEPKNPRRLDAMEQDLEAVERLLQELFSVSRAAWEERRYTPVDLTELAREASDVVGVSPEMVGHGIVQGDRQQLLRAMTNLLDNAVKYAGPAARIRVELDRTGFSVEDDGPGVPPSETERIFTPFHRAHPDRADGWGLGLMVVKQVAELHGGTVVGERSALGGLRVRLTLPGAESAPGDLQGR
ncbi:MAG: sensor histidine kinase [Myxococcota bacterium]